jgi:uncharacterized protein (DUF2267 family)
MKVYGDVYGNQLSGLSDSHEARIRISSYLKSHLSAKSEKVVQAFMERELGIIIKNKKIDFPYTKSIPDIQRFVSESDVTTLMNFLSIVRGVFHREYEGEEKAREWCIFVERVFREEGMAYTMDSEGMVHPYVDAEFAEHRALTLKGLEGRRYTSVRELYDKAYEALRADRQDTRTAVREMFAALECLARLMVPKLDRLNESAVNHNIAPLCRERVTEPHAREFTNAMLRALREWVTAHHQYRHEPGVEEPVPPSQDMAVLSLSTGSGFLRFLAAVDARRSGAP